MSLTLTRTEARAAIVRELKKKYKEVENLPCGSFEIDVIQVSRGTDVAVEAVINSQHFSGPTPVSGR